MTRPRVPENKRQRTARACDSCKRRKQKCNGLNPCNTCLKRSLVCEYTDGRSPPKRQGSATRKCQAIEARVSAGPETASTTPSTEPMRPLGTSMSSAVMSLDSHDGFFFPCRDTPTSDASSQSITSEDDDEFEVVRQCRMLEDSSNRLFYLGDSSSYSFVQLMRMIVDNAAGPSPFTVDPHRHKMLDTSNPPSHAPSTPYVLLPDRQMANLIVRSYFTRGIVELFDRRSLTGYLDACYSHPLSVDSSVLCSVYLVLAIGLSMAAPAPGSLDDILFRRLQGEQPSRAEALFRAAKTLVDPMSGANEADLWVIQVWTLMTLYLMITAKTTAAYSYCGMAIRSACALGLHRTRDTMCLFSNIKGHLTLRRNIWRSLFVLDRFLAASLGRPVALCDDDDEVMLLPRGSPSDEDDDGDDDDDGLSATIKGARSLGHIFRGLYGSKSTLSTRQAQDIVDKCDLWSMKPAPSPSSEAVFTGKVSAERGIAILHSYLMHYHAIILLTRPFFVHLLVRSQTKSEYRVFSSVEKYSQACVAASTWSISLIRAVYDANYLPRRNPFMLYFLFSSAVVVLSNEFSRLYQNAHYDTCIASVIAVLEHCGETDVQAPRMLYIIKTFQAAVEAHGNSKTYHHHHQGSEARRASIAATTALRSSQQYDIGGESGSDLTHVSLKQEPEDERPVCQW